MNKRRGLGKLVIHITPVTTNINISITSVITITGHCCFFIYSLRIKYQYKLINK